MANPAPEKAVTGPAVVRTGDHDRVQALSIRKDGTIDQHDPEIIGDPELALEATKEQFRQIAVAAVDAEKRAELGLAGPADEGDTSDKAIDALRKEHQKAEAEAEKKAEQVVSSLTK